MWQRYPLRPVWVPVEQITFLCDVAVISFLLVWAPISFAAGLGLTINEITPMDQGDEKDSAHCWLGFSTFQTEQNNVCLAVVIHSNKHTKN